MAKSDWKENEREKNCVIFPSLVVRKYKNGDVVRTGVTKGKEKKSYTSFLAQEYGGPLRRFTAFGEKGEDIVKMQLTAGSVCFIIARENAQVKIGANGQPDGYEFRYEVDRIQVKRRPDGEGKPSDSAELKTNISNLPAGVEISADMFLKSSLGSGEKRFG